LRSISEVFRPRFGGEGEGDLETARGGVNGIMAGSEAAAGERGVSSRLLMGGDFASRLGMGFWDEWDVEGPARVSNALILECKDVEGMAGGRRPV